MLPLATRHSSRILYLSFEVIAIAGELEMQSEATSLLHDAKLAQLRLATPEYLRLLDWEQMLYVLQAASARLKQLTGSDMPLMQPAIDIAAQYSKESIRQELINTPELNSFIDAIRMEALHQRERWSSEHDEGKAPEDWLWLVGYLATKATQAERYGDHQKYLHHIVTCAASCLNWHSNATGVSNEMRSGPPVPAIFASNSGLVR